MSRAPLAPIAITRGKAQLTLATRPRLIPVSQPAPAERSGQNSKPRVFVLGPLTITGLRTTGGSKAGGGRASALELIAYLALHPAGATRDEILEALWPDTDPRRSRQRLYQATRDARRLLGDALRNGRGRYDLDRMQVAVDADKLTELTVLAENAEDLDQRMTLLKQTLALFRGEPLAGADFRWAEGARRRLRGTHTHLLETVGYAYLAAGEPRQALDLAEQGLAIDNLNEAFWRLALEAESHLGLREALNTRYHHLQRTLGEQLGLEPAQETRMLYRTLLSQT